ncbi:Putative amino acid permease F13H103like, partial [Caligus rogercresseyi]
PRNTALEESNRHRNNLISRLAGPGSLPTREEDSDDGNDVAYSSAPSRFLVRRERDLTILTLHILKAYPDHLVPPQYFLLNVPVVSSQVESDGKQSSLVT